MADDTDYKPVELLDASSNVDNVANGSFYLNMFRYKHGWQTRHGMGQVAQFDSRLSAQSSAYGFQKVLGWIVTTTNSGSLQIVSVLLNYGQQQSEQAIVSPHPKPFYSVSIYDCTTNRQHEEVLFVHTARTISQPFQMMTAQTRWGERPGDLGLDAIHAVDEEVALVEYADAIVMTAPNMGIWVYNVVDIGDKPNVLQIDLWRRGYLSGSPLGESSRVIPIVATAGQFTDAVAYIGNDLFPNATDVEVINGVVVYASGRILYFSEPGKPASIPDTWRIPVNMQTEITAIAQNNGYLYIFGLNETWVFQPSTGSPASGQLTQLTDAIGCIGPSALSKMDGTLSWASLRGIHAIGAGPFDIAYISDEIRPMFDSALPNPVLNYYTAGGQLGVATTAVAPRMNWSWALDRGYVTMDYDILTRSLFVSVPAQNLVLVRQIQPDKSPSWSVWSFDTVTWDQGSNRPVAAQQNIVNPSIAAQNGRVWLIGGMQTQPATLFPRPRNGAINSYYICEWRRGGGLDRSSIPEEDMRQFGGQYHSITTAGQDNYVVLDRPTLWQKGTKMPSGAVLLQDTWMTPIRIWANSNVALTQWSFELTLATDSMVPVLVDPTLFSGDVDFLLGPERWPSRAGYAAGSVTFDVLTHVLSINFDGVNSPPPGSWASQPAINNPTRKEFPVMWIGFYGDNTQGVLVDTCTLGITPEGRGMDYSTALHVWAQPSLSYRETEDALAQGVDWAVQSKQVNLDGAEQIRSRSVWTRLMTSGKSSQASAVGWPTGLLNMVAAPDWKGWASQNPDFTGAGVNSLLNMGGAIQSVLNKAVDQGNPAVQALRQRLGIGAYNDPSFAAYDFANNLWGEDDTSTGTDYAGDDPFDTFSFSTALRGEVLAVMLFGHVLNRAEHLLFDRAQMLVKGYSNRRRTGR